MISLLRFNRIVQFNPVLSPLRVVPLNISPPPHVLSKQYQPSGKLSIIASTDDLNKLRYAGRVAGRVLSKAIEAIKANKCFSGEEVDELVHKEIIKHNCYPSSLGFMGFPKSLCVSPNDILCHGIPNKTPFKSGDFLNLDLTVYYRGMHADTSAMVAVGGIEPRIQSLIDKARMAMFKGIEQCKPNAPVSSIGKAIEAYLKSNRLVICDEFCGHGIGKEIHMKPSILHHDDKALSPQMIMKPGMVFTIEPIVLMNEYKGNLSLLPDKWAILSKGNPSAQWEHTILITEKGYQIITLRENERCLI